MNLIPLIALLSLLSSSSAVTIEGTFQTQEFFSFIKKFGFEKTNTENLGSFGFGYVFGNITSNELEKSTGATLAVLDRHHFLEFYKNRSWSSKNQACEKMFATLSVTAFDKTCNPNGLGDYLRAVPCTSHQVCCEEDNPKNLIQQSQFTFKISNSHQPKFWYVSIVSCFRNATSCQWEHYVGENQKMNYQIEMVNGNPSKEQQSSASIFKLHFSADEQNILEQCLVFFAIYILLVPVQIYGSRIQNHPVTKIFTISICLEFVSICFILIHLLRFAFTGRGNEELKITGEIFDLLSRTSFMLILLLLAKGWSLTRLEISSSSWAVLITIWISYLILNLVLYYYNKTEIDILSDIDEFQTGPGIFLLLSRSLIMIWFLFELRNTMKYEHSSKKLDFLLHFGASSLVWFIYMPIIGFISMQVSIFSRYKLLLAVTNSIDCLAYVVLMGLLWPHRSGQYLLLAGPNTSFDELEEFNEAPHNSREISTDPGTETMENNFQNDGDSLLLIENLELPATNKKSNIFT